MLTLIAWHCTDGDDELGFNETRRSPGFGPSRAVEYYKLKQLDKAAKLTGCIRHKSQQCVRFG